MSSAVYCLIPARGGSKGIPRKNLQKLAGRPLLAHSIEHALASPSIDRIAVSTDDGEIARVASALGAEVVPRPLEISGDLASSESALLHALDQMVSGGATDPELIVFLQATSPLRRPDDVERAIAQLRHEQADSLFSACPLHGFVWRQDSDRGWRSFSYDHRARQRRQELGLDVVENGSIYVFKPWVLRDLGNRLGGRISVYPMSALDSFQVDEPGDLELLEQLYCLRAQASPDVAQTSRGAIEE